MKRIIMHWTGGNNSVSDLDRDHYHEIAAGDGTRHLGRLRPEANKSTKDGVYVAHTRGLNTGSIGLAMAGMFGAKERPFSTGKYPINKAQLDVFCDMVAEYAETYGIPITPQTVLTHAEVEDTLGVKQRGKWDIAWLPGMSKPISPRAAGDALRQRVKMAMRGPQPEPKSSPWAGLFKTILSIFGGKK
jgi:hypothetical protein